MITFRTRLLTVTAAIVCFVFFIVVPLWQRAAELNRDIRAAQERCRHFQGLLERRQQITAAFQAQPLLRNYADAAPAGNPLQEIESLAKKSLVKIIDLRQAGQDSGPLVTYELRIEGREDQLLVFLNGLSSSSLNAGVDQFTLKSKPGQPFLEMRLLLSHRT